MARGLAVVAVFSAMLIVGVLFSVWPIGLFAVEAASTLPAVEWSRLYGGSETDSALKIQQTRDGGYVLIGGSYSYGDAGQGDGWLVKTLANGTMQWSKNYGVASSSDSFQAGEQISDGGYILAGTTTSSRPAHDSDAWLVKTDSNGNTVWSRSIGGSDHDLAYSVTQTSDGGYIVARRTVDATSSETSAWLDKTDGSGNVVWSRQYVGTAAWIRSVQSTGDGGYVFAGTTSANSASSLDFWLVKTNSSGNVLWDRKYGGTGNDEAVSVQLTKDGGYIVAGWTYSYGAGQADAWLVKVDSVGQVTWSQTYGGARSDSAMSVQQTLDGGYVFSGDSASFGVGAWLVKTASNGTMEWNKNYGDPYGFLMGYSVQQTSDGGFAVGGYCSSSIAGSVNAFLLKLMGEDADGDGLLDTWERQGIDFNNDGIVDLNLPGADWQKKDIFVEVDYMQGHRLSSVARDNVIEAFRNAPDPINLHIEIDDADNIPHSYSIKVDAYTGNWPDFDSIKEDHFGTPTQGNSQNVLNAKKMAYHYCLMIHNWAEFNVTSGKWEVTESSGIAEPYGNDFIVSLGSWTGGVGTVDEQAGTFMHELGHNLGLQHGGNDGINYKPNYLSVMNYFFQTPSNQFTRPLDYSLAAQPTLDEKALNEPNGVGAVAYWPTTVFSAPVWNATGGVWRFVPLPVSTVGAIDWNNNGEDNETGIWANLNVFPQWGYSYSPNNEILKGYNDWANLRFRFQDTKDFADNVHSTEFGVDELTWDTVEAMRESFSQLHEVAVFKVTSSSSVWQQSSSAELNLTLGNFGGSDENVNVTVYANSTVIASSNLVVKAGNLTSVTLPYTGQALNPGTFTLKATVSQVAGETYTADNTVTGGTITVTEAIPEFSSFIVLAAIITMTLAISLVSKRKTRP